jgi:hypothetical protein
MFKNISTEEMISVSNRENQFLAKESAWSLQRSKPVFKLDFTAHGNMDSLSEFGLWRRVHMQRRLHA